MEVFKREDLLTVPQVAKQLRCSRSHAYNLVNLGRANGGLSGFRVGRTRGLRVPKAEVERFKAANPIVEE